MPTPEEESACLRGWTPSVVPGHPFQDFMHPDVHWIENETFAQAFGHIIAGAQTMAAHTNIVNPITGENTSYPAFVNIRFEDGKAVLSVRGDPIYTPAVEGGQPEHYACGKQVEATFLSHDWDQFVAEATRERGLVPGG